MNNIIPHYPQLRFTSSSHFVYSPNKRTIFYDASEFYTPKGRLALLHEIGHAELNHQRYRSDIDLLNMEIDAWDYAVENAEQFDIPVDEAHIDRCLETYRVWLYKRSRCPQCSYHGIQTSLSKYRCFMCRHTWRVARTLSLQPHRMDCQHVNI